MQYVVKHVPGEDAVLNGYGTELLDRLTSTAARLKSTQLQRIHERNVVGRYIVPSETALILSVVSAEVPPTSFSPSFIEWPGRFAGDVQVSRYLEEETYPEFLVHCEWRVSESGSNEPIFRYSMYVPHGGGLGRTSKPQHRRNASFDVEVGTAHEARNHSVPVIETTAIEVVCANFLKFMLGFYSYDELTEIGADRSIDVFARADALRLVGLLPGFGGVEWWPGQQEAYEAILTDTDLDVLDRIRIAYDVSEIAYAVRERAERLHDVDLGEYVEPLRELRFELLSEIIDQPGLPTDIELRAVGDLGGPFALERIAKLMHSPDSEIAAEARDKLSVLVQSPSEPEAIRRNALELAIGGTLSIGHVFVSYVREDTEEVTELVKELNSNGIAIWRDKEKLRGGDRWKTEIENAIQAGGAFVAVFSDRSEERSRSFMREELIQAVRELRLRPTDRSWFIPVKLTECDIPSTSIGAGETLRDLHYVALYEPEGLKQLIESLAACLITR
jgi:hypothetical protein